MSLIPNEPTTEAPSIETPETPQATPEPITPDSTTTIPESTTETPSFLYADGIAGKGEIPSWFKSDKYTTVDKQAEAYVELEKKFGSFTGSPKDGKYEVEGVDFDDNPLMATVKDWGMERGLSNDGLTELVGKVSELATAQQTEDQETALKALGENGNQRLQDLAQWGRNNLSTEEFTQFQGLAQNAGQVEVMEKLIGMTKNSKLVDKAEVETASAKEDKAAELQKMQFAKGEDGRRLVETDPAYRAKYQKAMKVFYGS